MDRFALKCAEELQVYPQNSDITTDSLTNYQRFLIFYWVLKIQIIFTQINFQIISQPAHKYPVKINSQIAFSLKIPYPPTKNRTEEGLLITIQEIPHFMSVKLMQFMHKH